MASLREAKAGMSPVDPHVQMAKSVLKSTVTARSLATRGGTGLGEAGRDSARLEGIQARRRAEESGQRFEASARLEGIHASLQTEMR